MSLVNTETGELVEPMDADAARRLTERIRIAATNYTDAKAKVLQLVDEAKVGAAHLALGYKSWTAYLSDVLSDEPLRLAREDRRELVTTLANEGMSSRAIAPIVGASHQTVRNDVEASTVKNLTPDEPDAPKPAPVVRQTEGLDGKIRTSVTAGQTKPAPETTERQHQEAELINAFAAIVKRSLTPKNIQTLSPKAKQHLIALLEDAVESLKGTGS